MVTYQEFSAVDMRVGRILEASDLEGARKPIYKLKVDLGELGIREIAAGIKDQYTPEMLFGKSIVVVVNLDPKPIAGFISQGMALAVDNDSGISLLAPDAEVKPGAKVR